MQAGEAAARLLDRKQAGLLHWSSWGALRWSTAACSYVLSNPTRNPADLKPLYRSSSKAALLGQLFQRLAASLEESGALPPLEGSSQPQPAPQALVW